MVVIRYKGFKGEKKNKETCAKLLATDQFLSISNIFHNARKRKVILKHENFYLYFNPHFLEKCCYIYIYKKKKVSNICS